ncbi:hypothetical protein [Modestobacter altitudinis]|uniref:hypothetical protein n=1 Tax=Modestobacter altitudinis TaxID=2213158 RepID=UPI00110CA4B1|nr:hypothetical protein [Modestobacter altitudinis]
MSESTMFFDIVAPLRAEFAIDPRTGDLCRRRRGILARLVLGLSVLGCAQGVVMLTPDATLGGLPDDARPF